MSVDIEEALGRWRPLLVAIDATMSLVAERMQCDLCFYLLAAARTKDRGRMYNTRYEKR
jgi:hypothetical protein